MKKIILLVLVAAAFQSKAQGNCNQVHTGVSCPAQFPGGRAALEDWIRMSRDYFPAVGRVVVGTAFSIDTLGRPVNVRILRASAGVQNLAAEREALRLVNAMPLWTPARAGENCREKVCEEVTLPIVFFPGNAN